MSALTIVSILNSVSVLNSASAFVSSLISCISLFSGIEYSASFSSNETKLSSSSDLHIFKNGQPAQAIRPTSAQKAGFLGGPFSISVAISSNSSTESIDSTDSSGICFKLSELFSIVSSKKYFNRNVFLTYSRFYKLSPNRTCKFCCTANVKTSIFCNIF